MNKKDSCLIQSLGQVDNLAAQLDKCRLFAPLYNHYFSSIQKQVFKLGSDLSKQKKTDFNSELFVLEAWIELLNIKVEGFIRFNTLAAMEVNEARVRSRELERTLVSLKCRNDILAYANRLSSLLFCLAVKCNTS